jgi:hypothetical protein
MSDANIVSSVTKQPEAEEKDEAEEAKENEEIINCMAINCANTLSEHTNQWDFEYNDITGIRKI